MSTNNNVFGTWISLNVLNSRPFFVIPILSMNLYSLHGILQTLYLKAELFWTIGTPHKMTKCIGARQLNIFLLVPANLVFFGFFLDNLAFSENCPPRNSAIYTRKIVNKKSDCEKINSKLRFLFYFKVKQNKNL